MNERIRELAEQAGFKVDWQHEEIQKIKMARFEKFALLIVQECIRMVEGASDQYSEPVWAVELINDMADYFGVEE